jgi:predicted nucleotidyltransferase
MLRGQYDDTVDDFRHSERDDGLLSTLRDAFQNESDVLVAYLYGSHARSTEGPLSDIDVAVLLDDGADFDQRQLALIASLGQAIGSSAIDVLILNRAPVAVGYRVLRDGVLVLSRDDRARIDHWVRTVDRYLDMEPFRRTLERGQRHRLQEGRFGRS